jgi:hypothetical protein
LPAEDDDDGEVDCVASVIHEHGAVGGLPGRQACRQVAAQQHMGIGERV